MLHARVLFDSCSQLSYATPSLQRKLNLFSTKQKEISIQAFGKIDSRDTLDQVDLVILSTDKKEIPISKGYLYPNYVTKFKFCKT